MCGIAGFVRPRTEPSDLEIVRRMTATIRHRGPDDSDAYLDHRAALGHARLSIIDIAGGRQPMRNADGSLRIVFNGEIFNYVELREDLLRKGRRFATRSDTEVILQMFEEYGEDCVLRFNGDWAFAIWDAKKGRLFLSRDRMGVRPLFFTSVPGAFLFASEIKALLAYPGVSAELDLHGLDQVFTFWHTVAPRTAFQGIQELPPGHSAIVADGKLELKQYWDLDFGSPEPFDGDPGSEQRLCDELFALLEDATRIRLRADVPVGAYLSGGLDSTITAALAKRFAAGRLRTFSVRFEDDELDEGPFQQEAIRLLDTDHSDIRCSNSDIGNILPEVVFHTEKPVLRMAPAPLYMLSQLVRDSGYKVVLTGEGADEAFGGYDIFKEVKIRAFCGRRPESKWRPLLLKRLYPYLPNVQAQTAAYLSTFFAASQEDMRDQFFSHLPRWRQTAKLKGFFSAEVKARLGSADTRDIGEALSPAFNGWDAFARAQYLEARHLLPGYILSSQGDRMAMAHSVEGRFPFLDHRVVEFAAKLPARLKMKVLKEKYLLKRCARDLVPAAILSRPKQPYRAPDARSLFPGSHALDFVSEALSSAAIRQTGVFDAVAVGKLVRKAQRGDLTSNRDNMAVVGILSTQLLARAFSGGVSASGVNSGDYSHV